MARNFVGTELRTFQQTRHTSQTPAELLGAVVLLAVVAQLTVARTAELAKLGAVYTATEPAAVCIVAGSVDRQVQP